MGENLRAGAAERPIASGAVLRIVLPKGSLERATLELFEAADLGVVRSSAVEYKASIAQWHAERRGRRQKVAKLATNEPLRQYVQDRLSGVVRAPDGRALGPEGAEWKGRNKPHRGDRRWVQGWSPEQIANRLKVDFPDDEDMRISHETIYRALYVQGRGQLRRELARCLRTGRAVRKPRRRVRAGRNDKITDKVMISQRPAEVADRAVPGHWEGDLVFGKNMSPVATLVERKTRFLMLVGLPRGDHQADTVADALAHAEKMSHVGFLTLPDRGAFPRIVGAKGSNVARLRNESGADITVSREDNTIVIVGACARRRHCAFRLCFVFVS